MQTAALTNSDAVTFKETKVLTIIQKQASFQFKNSDFY